MAPEESLEELSRVGLKYMHAFWTEMLYEVVHHSRNWGHLQTLDQTELRQYNPYAPSQLYSICVGRHPMFSSTENDLRPRVHNTNI